MQNRVNVTITSDPCYHVQKNVKHAMENAKRQMNSSNFSSYKMIGFFPIFQ